MEKSIKKLAVIFIMSGSAFFAGCGGKSVTTPEEVGPIAEFHETYFAGQQNPLEEGLTLFVDYSTCISQGQHSKFFQELIPTFCKAKHYFSIKGSEITEESPGLDIYTELKNIVEVSYADLKTAAKMITESNRETILLTDGEYFQNNIAKGNVNNPYLADAFKTWLKKGHDIYIIAEPYQEINRRKSFNKKRFYFIFTDADKPDNVYAQINTKRIFEIFPEVRQFHLTADYASAYNGNGKTGDNKSLFDVADFLMANTTPHGLFEIEEWDSEWKFIESLAMAENDENGKPLPLGNVVLGNFPVDRDIFGGCKITNVKIKVYDVSESYTKFYYSKEDTSVKAPTPEEVHGLPCHENFFVLDDKAFEKDNVVNIHLDKDMWTPGNVLTGRPFNFTKVDICAAGCNYDKVYSSTDNVVDELFKFDAIEQPGEQNVSVAASIKECLLDKDIRQMMESAVLYTVYIKSNQY